LLKNYDLIQLINIDNSVTDPGSGRRWLNQVELIDGQEDTSIAKIYYHGKLLKLGRVAASWPTFSTVHGSRV